MSEKKRINEKISDALDIPVTSGEIIDYETEEQNLVKSENTDLDVDYRSVRQNLQEIIDRGKIAIDGILTVAEDTDSPRAYEVAAQMIKNVADINKDLIDIHNKLRSIKSTYEGPKTVTTNNTLFVGSTKELQKFIKQQQEMLLDSEEGEEDAVQDE